MPDRRTSKSQGSLGRKIHPNVLAEWLWGAVGATRWQPINLQLSRKYPQQDVIFAVPQTETGGLVEKTKVDGRRRLKELGKKAGRKLARCPPLTTLS